MGMFSEFLRYFFAVIGGKRDPLISFTEPLTMAERYLRWGREKGDLRDFHAGLEQLRLCVDADAPLSTLLIRKYTCLIDLAQAGVETLLARHERKLHEWERREKELRFERDNLAVELEGAKADAARLKADGSLLKAREKEKVVVEHNNRLAALSESLTELEERGDICDSYDETVAECERFFQYLDQAQVMVTMSPKLPADMRDTLVQQLRERLDQLRERINQVDPIRIEPESKN